MRVVAHISPGPRWLSGKSVYGQGALIEDHLDYMCQRFDDHSLLLGGPMAGGMSGLALLEVPDRAAAYDVANADPAVAGAVLVYSIEEFVPFFDVVSGVRAGRPTAERHLRQQPARS